MEKEKKEDKSLEKIKVIKQDALVSVNANTNFYLRMLDVANYLVQTKTQTEIEEINKHLGEENITDDFTRALQTVYIFINSFRNAAIEQNAIEEKTQEEVEEDLKKLIS